MTKEDVRRQLEHNDIWKLLNQIESSGEATKQLLSILPAETVSTILRVFRELKRLSKIEDYDKLPKKGRLPTRELKTIQDILNTIKTERVPKGDKMKVRQGYLDDRDIEDIMTYIKEIIKQGPKGLQTLQAMGKERIRRAERQTKKPDIALNMAISLLAEHLKDKTNKIQWSLIYDFLTEQEPEQTKAGVDYKDRYRKINKKRLQAQYQNYRDLWLFPERNIKRTITGTYQQMIYLRDITLPLWDELLP